MLGMAPSHSFHCTQIIRVFCRAVIWKLRIHGHSVDWGPLLLFCFSMKFAPFIASALLISHLLILEFLTRRELRKAQAPLAKHL